MRDLAIEERSSDVTGWLHRMHAWLFGGDIFASVAANSDLLRIHSTAEEFEPAAEQCFVPFQVHFSRTPLHHDQPIALIKIFLVCFACLVLAMLCHQQDIPVHKTTWHLASVLLASACVPDCHHR